MQQRTQPQKVAHQQQTERYTANIQRRRIHESNGSASHISG
ncbi:hypothetical protein ThidrDRAFT_0677 [Thiorhodococcus drewsii AZ1]|uniref:Uncharacterized protein n=1 Tax=Thiorhodococcus drewsii AZ1 TaxID=765913 RepID=G2DXB6_9GAMM|nr:hypothetical protein ThidrDRAFT_0677 [Thiorhodococcus drewsii AZ1]